MKKILGLAIMIGISLSCKEEPEISSMDAVNWGKRSLESLPSDSLVNGTTYLSVYSEIYSQTEHRTHDLTVTVSMRNANERDSIYINSAQYFNTSGELIRTYFSRSIFLGPMETVEIVIDELDREGGTGANFLFRWSAKPGLTEPLFEGVMISTSGQQGLSFTTQGRRLD